MKTRGICCKNLGLVNISPQTLEISYRNFLNPPIGNGMGMDKVSQSAPTYQDIWLIYPMLRFLYADKKHPNGDVEIEHIVYHYSCVHLDPKTGKCSIYEIRPRMCMSFPDGLVCRYEGCRCPGDGRKEWALRNKNKKHRMEKSKKALKEECFAKEK